MGRPPLNPTGPMTAAERQARRRARVAQRAEILAKVAERTQAATAALTSPAMPLCNLIVVDPAWPHVNYSAETGSDRSSDNFYQPMSWDQLEALGAKLPAAPDSMLLMWVPRPLVVKASALLIQWGWDPLRTTEMIWLKMRGDKIWTGMRLRDQHETILIAVRGTIPPALPMWPSVMIAPVGEHSTKPKLLMEWIDRDYAPPLVRIEMFARPPFDRRG